MDLRDLSDNGFVWFTIRAKDTEHNVNVHKSFQEFANVECKGDYTLALHLLLSYYSDRGMFEAISNKLLELEQRIADVESKSVVKDDGVF